jgi:hypothetical protein
MAVKPFTPVWRAPGEEMPVKDPRTLSVGA